MRSILLVWEIDSNTGMTNNPINGSGYYVNNIKAGTLEISDILRLLIDLLILSKNMKGNILLKK